MGFWRCTGSLYMRRHGVEAPQDLDRTLMALTMDQGAAYLRDHFDLKMSPQQILQDMEAMIGEQYVQGAPLKPQALDYLDRLKARDCPMAVLTATPRSLAEPALRRLGVLDRFLFVMDCTSGRQKDNPEVFLEAAGRLGLEPGDIEVYEDSLYAVRTARTAGFFVTAIADDWAANDEPQLRRWAHRYIQGWQELLEEI